MQAQTKKIVIIGSVIGAILIGAAAIIFSKRKTLEKKIQSGSSDVINPANATATTIMFPLQNGSGKTTAEKNAVKVVQRYINAKSADYSWLQISILTEDGIFGPLTEGALYKMMGVKQVSYSLYMDMQSYLTAIPKYLDPSTPGYTGPAPTGNITDPAIVKNDLFNFDYLIN
jgi:hypothetical protein